MKNSLQQLFDKIYNRQAERFFFAPGRVNLIGEHTDYNGGHVFPCAITQGTYGALALRTDRNVRCYSANFPEVGVLEFSLDDLTYREEDGWTNFVKGMLSVLSDAGHEISQGFDLLIEGNIPNGAGLSSSASLEVLVGTAMNATFSLGLSPMDLALFGQKVENDYIGVNSGIMDQFAVAFGEKDHAIYLDVNTMAYERVPADFGEAAILIMNTNKRRELVRSNYNERRKECEEALKRLQEVCEISSLGDLTMEEFEAHRSVLQDPILEKRARHAISENVRTKLAADVLTAGDLESFGKLMDASHDSLRDDYEVTGIELDTLVDAARQQAGVLGARMTGAGMGGCAIALIERSAIPQAEAAIAAQYEDIIGYPPSFYIAEVGAGAHEIIED